MHFGNFLAELLCKRNQEMSGQVMDWQNTEFRIQNLLKFSQSWKVVNGTICPQGYHFLQIYAMHCEVVAYFVGRDVANGRVMKFWTKSFRLIEEWAFHHFWPYMRMHQRQEVIIFLVIFNSQFCRSTRDISFLNGKLLKLSDGISSSSDRPPYMADFVTRNRWKPIKKLNYRLSQ